VSPEDMAFASMRDALALYQAQCRRKPC